MDYYSTETYGERIANVYDQWYSEFDPAAIQVLAHLADGGNALELGIGTGRIALPLKQIGLTIQGIDASEAMVARLHAKPGGESIPVSMGNFADVAVEGQYELIYVVFNTFFSLLTMEEQVRCFENVSRHLAPSGVFVVEVFVPDLSRFTANQAVRVTHIGENEVHVDVTQLEPVQQVVHTQHIVFNGNGTRLYPVKLRFAYPAEMDLMARLSHLRLRCRWADWRKTPFSASSRNHVSVYEHQPA